MLRTIAVYIGAYLATFLLRALTGGPGADVLLGFLVTIALVFHLSRCILFRMKKKDEAGRYADRIMTGRTLYLVVMAVALPISLVAIVGYMLIYTLTL